MPIEVAEAALKWLVKCSRDRRDLHLTLFGGEPLVCMDRMEDILEIATALCKENDKELALSCTTNGTLIDERAMDIADKYNFKYLLSIDGIKDVHDRYRRTVSDEPTYDKIMEKIPFLKKRQGWLGARITVTPESIAYLFQGVKELFEVGVNQFLLGLVVEAEWSQAQLAQIKEQYYQLFDFYVSAREANLPIRIGTVEGGHLQYKIERGWACGAGISGIAVDVEGAVYPCSRFLGKEKYAMGNILDGDINWGVRNRITDPRVEVRWKCLKCEYADYCMGGCPESNVMATGTPFYPAEAHCAEVKAALDLLRYNPRFHSLVKKDDEATSDKCKNCSHVHAVKLPPQKL